MANEAVLPEHATPVETGAKTARTWTGSLAILGAALLWSSAGLLIKYIPWHPMAIAAGRSLLTSIVFVLYFRRKAFCRPNLVTWLAGFALMLTQLGFIMANKLTTAANAIMLQYTMPVFIIIMGAVFFKIKPKRREIIALIWALAGIVLFFLDSLQPGQMLGNLLAVATGLTFAGVFVLNNRPTCQIPTALLIGQAGTFLTGLPWLATVNRTDFTYQPLFAVVLLGIFQLGLSYILFQYGIRRTLPLHASLLSMVEPIMNPVWVFLLLGEQPGFAAILGAVVVISAILFLNLGQINPSAVRRARSS
ncbi:MAG: EamA family transporter [Ruminococcaceae bacterium]|jgi:drug/metabolite transporter (DMT)-like permease|nr:EamA family transporter [Oscillospiraceae bacterium]